ncbi:MAG TPA: peptidylprolyl isomerase [Gammaproteobacteria bacterium]
MSSARTVVPLIAALAAGMSHVETARGTEVAVCTDAGRFVIELADAQAPKHVANFLQYVDMGFYSGTVFHRVVEGFVVQGGGVDRQLRPRPTLPPVENESHNTLSNVRGSVAAARTADPNSATSQFYVNLTDNRALDAGAEPGYTVFGHVREGLDVLDQISALPTGAAGPFSSDVPQPLIAIRSMARLDKAALAELPEANRADVIKARIASAAEANDDAQVMQWIEHYRATCADLDPELLVTEARSALALDRQARARFVLEDYFGRAERTDAHYDEAVALYREVTPSDATAAAAAALGNECSRPEAPAIPDGETATLDEMMAGQTAMREFVSGSESYLDCLAKIIDDEEQAAERRNAAIGEHNRMVSTMEALAESFNTEVRAFKARE